MMAKFKTYHWAYLLFVLALLMAQNNIWEKNTFVSDVDQYYSYLPTLIIHKTINYDYPNGRGYWTSVAPNGNHTPKMSGGMAITYAPFFMLAYCYQSIIDPENNTGYERSYEEAAQFWCIFLALLFLRLVHLLLRPKFGDTIALSTAFILYFGTNILYYNMGAGLLTHFTLAIINLFTIYVWQRWRENKVRNSSLITLSFLLGLSIVIRPTAAIILIFAVLLLFFDKPFQRFFLNRMSRLKVSLGILLAFLIPIFLQMVFWKLNAGQWVYYSYGEEGFFFNDPEIANFLWSYRKGWFVYTPLSVLFILGLLRYYKIDRAYALASIVLLALSIYIFSSWWCWWFGGGFSSRSMVDFLPFFALPFASTLFALKKKKYALLVACFLVFPLVSLNVFQTHQKSKGLIHHDAMSKASYWGVFLKNKMPLNYYALIKDTDAHGAATYSEQYKNEVKKQLTNQRIGEGIIEKKLIQVQLDSLPRTHFKFYSEFDSSLLGCKFQLVFSDGNTGEERFRRGCEVYSIGDKEKLRYFALISENTSIKSLKNAKLQLYIKKPIDTEVLMENLSLEIW